MWPRNQYVGPGGGRYVGPGGGMYVGPGDYKSNIPPWEVFIEYLEQHNMRKYAHLIRRHLPD